MLKGTIFKICFAILIFTFCSYTSIAVVAQDCNEDITGITTAPGNFIIPDQWLCVCSPYIPLGFDDGNTPDTIGSGQYINVYVTNGCAPYTYNVSGKGYTWHENGLTSVVSNNLNERLDCASGA